MSIKLSKEAAAKQPARLKGFIICAGMVGAVLAALYPIYFYPKMHISDYQDLQKITRKDIKQEDVQPGNMNVWRDPFERKKE